LRIEAGVVRSETERRVASDGKTYTRKDFEAKFGSDGWESTKELEQNDRPQWTIQKFLGPDLGNVVSDALTPASAKENPEQELALFRALGRKGSVSLVKKLLEAQDTLTKLATHIMESAQKIATADAATGEELNDKFAAGGGFVMSYGGRSDYFNGLEPRVGAPKPRLLEAMAQEHCDSADSHVEWTTGNYGITSTAFKEFCCVAWEVIDEMKSPDKESYPKEWRDAAEKMVRFKDNNRPDSWPIETINTKHPRSTERTKDFLMQAVKKNQLLEDMDEKVLLIEEVLALRLYTGPLFEKYNAVNRGGSLGGDNNKFMEQAFFKLCGGEERPNRYTTTIHVLSSGMIKISKLSVVMDVYRGISGGRLSESFWKEDATGVRGGVEYGFMSTTTDKDVAFQYARGGGAGTILEIRTGMIDKGADLCWLSQYPHECELCFPPLTSMEVMGTRVEGSVLVISLRLNINLTSQTIDEAVGKRRKVVSSMCDDILVEAKNSIKGKSWDALCRELKDVSGQVKVEVQAHAEQQLSKIKARSPDDFNMDKVLLGEMQKALSVGSRVRLQRAMVLDQAAGSLQDVALAKATRSLATEWRRDERWEQDVPLKFEMNWRPNGELWLSTVLGFQLSGDGELEVSREKQYTDFSNEKQPTELSKYGGHEQITGQILVAIDGIRDLGRRFRELQAAWEENAELSIVLTLGRNHSTEEALQIFKSIAETSGDVEVVASRLTRLLEVNPGLEHLEELNLDDAQLSDEAGAAIAIALARASTAVTALSIGTNPGFSLQAARALGCLLAANNNIQELFLMNCAFGDEAGAELLKALARRSKGSSQLRMLGLEDNGLGNKTAVAMEAALRADALPSLEILGLDDNAFSQVDEALIRAGWEETKGKCGVKAQLCGF